MLPQEIAEQLKPDEYTELIGTVEEEFHQKFGVISVTRNKGHATAEIELDDRTRHEIELS